MAKSSRVSVSSGSGVSLSKLRSFCTAAERKLLEMSESTGLSKATHAEVQALQKSIFAAHPNGKVMESDWLKRQAARKQQREQAAAAAAIASAIAPSKQVVNKRMMMLGRMQSNISE
jgi:hypothetical protein